MCVKRQVSVFINKKATKKAPEVNRGLHKIYQMVNSEQINDALLFRNGLLHRDHSSRREQGETQEHLQKFPL